MKQPGPDEAQWQIMSIIKPGESLIWFDGLNHRRASIIPAMSTVFMSLWTLFSGVLTVAMFRAVELDGTPTLSFFVGLFGVAVTVFGAVLFVTYGWRLLACRATFYGLTDRRFIILIRTWPGQVVSLDANQVSSVEACPDGERIRIETRSKSKSRRTGFLIFPTDNVLEVATAIRKVVLSASLD